MKVGDKVRVLTRWSTFFEAQGVIVGARNGVFEVTIENHWTTLFYEEELEVIEDE